MNRYWTLVIMGGILEVLWVSGLKHADSVLGWIGTGLVIVVSFFLMVPCLGKLPVGTVYAVFTGIGTAGTVLAEMLFYGEPVSWAKISLIALLLAGVMGLKAVTGEPKEKGSEA
ncbi:multidrug efflux SMR transporter [Fictibacillus sp. KIGAM418]|uniref:Multidrug efflux SMR transporter n=1 Tax=Fictibacillus marinisediminis TaxID=2878389 RepID=A0A9X1X7P7_9BACL|nr:multidrug efflux SMR transporter [Fictibacillus marinisediminis]MCK6255426.1 multidrug efflux SMR transporter [Fictibacillus marinisediminis]